MKQFAVSLLLVFLVSCGGYSKDPEIAAIQKWTETCTTYKETLKAINDALELQILKPTDIPVLAMGQTKTALSPLCRSAEPPADVGRESLQELLDAQLVQLIKIKKGIP